MRKIIITIDGYSSTGKSTLAQSIAKEMNYRYIDTGAMYRALTYYAIEKSLYVKDVLNQEAFLDKLPSLNIDFDPKNNEILLNKEKVGPYLRSIDVSNKVSEISNIAEVRKKLLDSQRGYAKDKGLVMDGRDIGSVVFPNAELKLFITADLKVRAERRYKELQEKKIDVSYKSVYDSIKRRDKMDSTRKNAPLIKPENAIVIDNTNMSQKAQLNLVLTYVKSLIN